MTKISTPNKPKNTPKTGPMLYLLTNDDEFDLLYAKLTVALATGTIGLLQIRRKQVLAQPNGQEKLYAEAVKIVALAERYKVPVIINDDLALAAKLGVGVHLGQQDGAISEARQQLKTNQIIGRTCHGDVTLIKKAIYSGVTYIAMGAIFASSTKPKADTITRQQLIDGCQQAADNKTDVCIIGGLTAENIHQLKGLPIAYVAVVGDIMDLPIQSIEERCQKWQQALTNW
ncbi:MULTISPECIES: thiamine phosphate synthase [unclassified Psychrobacter]|uniref:thiamine phosphate synthase n=1 Tax=unclassified Psychrobacter TaxID=196806 RepID=UPI00071E6A87|nr:MULTISPECIES: thiamine phosphate synthase [unclassified Psychrobacter]